MTNLELTHRSILDLQAEMVGDPTFKELCEKHGLPWNPDEGYEPRWYNGPAPEQVRVLFFMAEPGAITATERNNLLPPVTNLGWIGNYDLKLTEHYWRKNLRELCCHIWPHNTEQNMREHLGGSCTFWMSLAPGHQTKKMRVGILDYFLRNYLSRFLKLFPNAILLAAGGKAKERLGRLQKAGLGAATYEGCYAFTRPAANQPIAHETWCLAGQEIARRLSQLPR